MDENMECPICKKKVLFVGVHDDEGNYHGLVGCEYENDPWSGLSYALHHEGWGDCLLCTDGAYSTMGGMLFDTAEDAISALSPPNEPLLDTDIVQNSKEASWLLDQVLHDIQAMPTLTSPNEWVSVETPPTTQGWYHVAVLDLKTGKYTVEQDLYSIELAKAHGFEPGFCKANRWEERERIDYWCRFPAPPNRRPPEGDADA